MTFTTDASNEIKRTLGLQLERITIDEHPAVADELAALTGPRSSVAG